MNKPAETQDEEQFKYDGSGSQEYDYGNYEYDYNNSLQPQTVYAGASNGTVYYDQQHYMRDVPYGAEGFSPANHGYMNEYNSNVYVPFHAQQPRFYNPQFQQHDYYSSYQSGPYQSRGSRGRGRGRGFFNGRGRGNRNENNQYYGFDSNYVVPCYGGYDNMDGESTRHQQDWSNESKPKQFSYQGNRYRHDRDTRKRNTSNSDNINDDPNNGQRKTHKSYSLLRNQQLGEKQVFTSNTPGNDSSSKDVEVENYHSKGFDEKEDDEYSYVEKTQSIKDSYSTRNRGYRSQRNVRGRESGYGGKSNRSDSNFKYNRGRGGYSNSKRSTNSNENSREMSRSNPNVKATNDANPGNIEEKKQSMTVLRSSKNNETLAKNKTFKDSTVDQRNEESTKTKRDQEKEDKKKIDAKQRNRSNQHYRGRKFHFKGDQDDDTQRGLLIEQLSTNSYECMVCCENVRRDAAVWSCNNCYHVFHLRCIKKWARSPTAAVEGGQTGWRCPACQNVTPQVPNQYRCFCAKVRDPDSNRYDTPHSCGEVCRKKRESGCPHPCNILCHPGPCPVCEATISKSCNCGRFKMTVKCGQAPAIQCQEVCGKRLNCGRHECKQICHEGSCKPCEEKINQVCFCEAHTREVVCGSTESFTSSYSCGNVCKRNLDCGNHTCEKACHPGVCDSCSLSPSAVKFCPCQKTALSEITPPGEDRKNCTDPIPTCDKLCDKQLNCGPKDNLHKCKSVCHIGECGTCEDNTEIECRCGALTKLVPCTDLGANQFICDKRCNKKRDCTRHRCTQLCCVDEEHKCDIICGRKLSCNLHRCEELCHRGNCHACWNVSFEELHCHCGTEVLYPPVACGTRPPECKKRCTRMHPCGHEVLHNCHSEDKCPPCTQLTEKWCLGKHERRRNIPCHITDITCGMKCNKPLECGQHKCQQTCHKGDCIPEGEKCEQPCTKLRENCAHICGAPCHQGKTCPHIPCKAEVTLKCDCGSRSEKGICQLGGEDKSDYQRIATSMLAMKMSDARDGQSIDISNIMGSKENRNKPRKLECTPECAIKERNRRLALALEIKNPDLSSKLGSPTYTEFLKEYAKKNASFVSNIEKALSELVQTAQKSVKKNRSHAFTSMNRDQRRVVHELSEFYGCSTQSYDEEPKKNVVATASKDKCFKPSVTLTALVQREMHPKAPVPIPHRSSEERIRSTVQASKLSTSVVGGASSSNTSTAWNSKTSKPLNSWTTLKSSKSSTNNNNSSSSSSPPLLRSSQSDPRIGDTGSAWGYSNNPAPSESKSAWGTTLFDSSQSAGRSSYWGQSSATTVKKVQKKEEKKTEPVIDYFEMTD